MSMNMRCECVLCLGGGITGGCEGQGVGADCRGSGVRHMDMEEYEYEM